MPMLQLPIPEEKPPVADTFDPYHVESSQEPEEETDSKPSSPTTVPEPSRVEDVPMSTTETKPSETVIHTPVCLDTGKASAPNKQTII